MGFQNHQQYHLGTGKLVEILCYLPIVTRLQGFGNPQDINIKLNVYKEQRTEMQIPSLDVKIAPPQSVDSEDSNTLHARLSRELVLFVLLVNQWCPTIPVTASLEIS